MNFTKSLKALSGLYACMPFLKKNIYALGLLDWA